MVGARTLYYAVGVYSERRPDGTVNGIPVFDAAWKNVVATFYHEVRPVDGTRNARTQEHSNILVDPGRRECLFFA